jgi:hypothetical protein
MDPIVIPDCTARLKMRIKSTPSPQALGTSGAIVAKALGIGGSTMPETALRILFR